jgi:hypothetical protein
MDWQTLKTHVLQDTKTEVESLFRLNFILQIRSIYEHVSLSTDWKRISALSWATLYPAVWDTCMLLTLISLVERLR